VGALIESPEENGVIPVITIEQAGPAAPAIAAAGDTGER
jgi:hypothetical protein